MKNARKNETKPPLTDSEIEQTIDAVLRNERWLIPETAEEVEAVERELEGQECEIPPVLRDPASVYDAIVRPGNIFPLTASDDPGCAEPMARAAREGRKISPSVEEKMKQDRQKSQGSSDEQA